MNIVKRFRAKMAAMKAALALYRDYAALRARLMTSSALVIERKDAGADFGAVKDLLEKQAKAFEQFKIANDAELAAIKSGKPDTVLAEKVDKINAELTRLSADIGKQIAHSGEIEKKLNRQGLGDDAGRKAEVKACDDYNIVRRAFAAEKGMHAPQPLTVEQYVEGKAAMERYWRFGKDGLSEAQSRAVKAMSVGADAEGGYLVPADMSGRIVTRLYASSPMRQLATVQAISTDALEGIEDTGEADSGWVAETGTRTDTTSPQVGKWRIPTHEQYAKPKVTQKLLDDAAIDVEGWLVRKIADKLTRRENTAFVSGDGVGKPRGITTYPTAATADASRTWGTFEHVVSGTNGSLGVGTAAIDKLIDVQAALKPEYAAGASWFMSRASVATIRKLRDGAGQYVWLPSMDAKQPSTILGSPVVTGEDMPALSGTGSLGIAYGDFREAYTIVDRKGMTMLRDPYSAKPYVEFYTTKRVGGGALNYDAIKFVKTST